MMAAPRRVVEGRVLLSFPELCLPISDTEAVAHLDALGFRMRPPGIIRDARSRIGWSVYKRYARMAEAPKHVDCSSFVKWAFSLSGIWLPRFCVQQRELGQEVSLNDARPGDLIFMSADLDRNRAPNDPGIGHVGIIASERSVIHAVAVGGVTEGSPNMFLGQRFRGVRRMLPDHGRCVVVEWPKEFDIETSDDIYWMLRERIDP
jgi:cell wall-associated NlpC family hydrolase